MSASTFAHAARGGRRWVVAFGLVALVCLAAAPARAQSSASSAFLTHGEREWLAEHPVIRLAPDPNFPPIEFFDSDGVFKGIAAEYVSLIEAKLGIRFEIVKTRNWTENVALTKARGNDVWAAVARTPSRLEYMKFTPPYFESPAVIVVQGDEKAELTSADLKGKTVAVVANYGVHEYLLNNYPDLTLDTVPDVLTGLRMVSFGIVDAMVVNMALASHVIEKSAITNLRVAGNTDFIYRWGLAARRDWPQLREILEKTLAQINSQERSAISRKWIAFKQPGWSPSGLQLTLALLVLALLIMVGVLLWVRMLNRLVKRRTEEANSARDTSAAAEASLRLAIETMSEGFVYYNADERLVICNNRFRDLYGYSEAEARPGAWAYDLFALDAQRDAVVISEHAGHEFRQRREITRRDGEGSFEVKLMDGRWLQIRESITADGGVVSIQADITEQKAAAEELAQARDTSAAAEHRLLLAIESMSEGFVHYDADDRLVNCNSQFRDLYGYSEDEAAPGTGAQELSLLDEQRQLVVSSNHPDGKYIGRRPRLKEQGRGTFQLQLADGRWLQIRESTTSDGGVVSVQADITERKRAEAELAEKTAILEHTLNAMDQGIAMYDGDHNLLAWNRAFMELRDFPEHELYRGKPLSDVVRYQAEQGGYDGRLHHLGADIEKQVQYWTEMVDNLSGNETGIQHRADGTIHEIRANLFPEGSLLLTFTDVTIRQQAEEALKEREGRLREILEHSPIAISIIRDSGAGERVYSNQSYRHMLTGGDAPHLPLAHIDDSYVNAEDHEQVLGLMAEEGVLRGLEVERRRADGETFWALMNSQQVDYEGAPADIVWLVDITGRKAAEAALRESQARYQSITANIPGVVYQRVMRADGSLTYPFVSSGMRELYGLEADEIMAEPMKIFSVLELAEQQRVQDSIAASAAALEPWNAEFAITTPAGQAKWIRGSSSVRRVEGGATVWDGVLLDVTARKQAEEAMRESEARLLHAQRLALMGDWVADLASGEQIWSEPLYEIIGLSPSIPASFETFLNALHPDDRDRVESVQREAFRKGEAFAQEYRVLRPDGAVRVLLTRNEIEHDAEGVAVRAIGTAQDITERKQAEEALASRTALIRLLQRTAAEANEATSLAAAMQGTLTNVCFHNGWPVGHAYVLSPEQADLLTSSNIWHLDDAERFATFRQLTEETTFNPHEGLPGRVLASGRPAWVTDVNKDVGFLRAQAAENIGVTSGFACPVLAGTKVVAVLEFYTAEKVEPDQSLLEALVHVGLELGRVYERERSETALRESEAELSDILEASPISVSIAGPDGKIRYANSSAVEARRISEEEAQESTAIDHFFDDAERDRVLQMLQEKGRARDQEVRLKRGADSYFWSILSLNPISYQGEESFVSWFIDISDRKRAEAELAEKEAQLRSALDNMSGGIYMVDKDLKLLIFNDNFQTLYEIPEGVIRQGVPIRDVVAIRAARGDYGPGDVEEMVTDRLAGFFNTEAHFMEDRVPSGRTIENMRAPTDQGGIVSIFSDVTERKQAKEELERQTSLLNKVLQSTSQGIAAFDGERRLVAYNQQFREIWDFPEALLRVGAPALEIALATGSTRHGAEAIGEAVAQAWIDDLATGEGMTGEARGLDGQQYEVLSQKTSDGSFVVSFSNVTERINAAQELERARDQAEAATRSKSAFLASMSHEIRTPMNGVVGMIELLSQTRLDNDQRDMSDTIRKSAFALLQIIDDILDFSKIEAGQLDLEHIPLSLSDVVETVADILGPVAREKGLAMVAFVDPTIPEPMLGDPVRLRQILFNLLGNAIKFTSQGQVTIRAERLAANKSRPETLRLEIIDTGIGIPAAAVDGLFEAFTQAETSTTRRFGGTGLGLSICTHLVELMDGTIAVASQPGAGSTFTVSLPFEPAPGAAGAAAGQHDLAGLRVLLAAGNDDARGILKYYLRHWQAEVNTTGNIDRVVSLALKAAREGRRFDVIILGALWSEEKKAKISDAVRGHAELVGTRFVLAIFDRRTGTGRVHNDSVEVSVHPMRRATFLTAVAVAAGRQSPELPPDEEFWEIGEVAVPSVEQARSQGKLILVAEDHPTNRVVILRQLNRLGLAAEIAVDGRQALDMWQAGSYALVLTDGHMPEMDGFELTAGIRRAEAAGHDKTPIVAITANALQGEAERCLEAGMDDYLAKPIELLDLRRVLSQWLPAAEPAMPEQMPIAAESSAAINMAEFGRLLGSDDSAYLGDMLAFFWQTVADTPQQLVAAIEARDAAALREVAHAAKGAAGSAAAGKLAAALQDLEDIATSGDWSAIAQIMTQIEHEFSAVELYIGQIAPARN